MCTLIYKNSHEGIADRPSVGGGIEMRKWKSTTFSFRYL